MQSVVNPAVDGLSCFRRQATPDALIFVTTERDSSPRTTENLIYVRGQMIFVVSLPLRLVSLFAARMIEDHHHNDDQTARRPRILCSICGLGALTKTIELVIASHYS